MDDNPPRYEDAAERRRHRRLDLRIPLHVAIGDGLFMKEIALESSDVSGGGLRFETSKELPLEGHSTLAVARLGSPSALIEGRVAHVEALGNGRFSVGIAFEKFVNVDPDELLERILEAERQG